MKQWMPIVACLLAAACTSGPPSSEPAPTENAGAELYATAEFRGVRTVVYITPDLEAGKRWYASVFGIEPYFDEPFYVGFQVGEFELGLDPDTALAHPGRGGTWVYWEVDDAAATYARLLDLGASEVSAVSDVGGGTLVATVEDPFGNLFGVIQLPD